MTLIMLIATCDLTCGMQSGKRGAEGRQGGGLDSRRVSTESRGQSLQSRQASLKSLGSLERRP